jgi:hypothetical protein
MKALVKLVKPAVRGRSALSAAAAALVLMGCASPARVDQMQVDPPVATRVAAASSGLKENIGIKDVTGGQETNPMWVSNISSNDFERALEASLRNAGLLSINRQGSKYVLTAHMLKLEQPLFGASMTVTATVRYELIERASGKPLLSSSLTTPFTAEFGAAFLGAERLKLANEGAARTNIQQLIEVLVALRL